MKAGILLILFLIGFASAHAGEYAWLQTYDPSNTVAARFPVPPGYQRIPLSDESFGKWLRGIPLKPKKSKVCLYNGKEKGTQNVHAAVVDMDVGTRDLQQCADAVIRLRAEYLFARGDRDAVHFNFTSGDKASFAKWSRGYRPVVKGNKVRWRKSRKPGSSYAIFKSYLQTVFMYAGTHSLEKELQPVEIESMQVGDVFVQGGFPGHAVIVVDMAQNPSTGGSVFMLAQSYMPAQDVHILRNPAGRTLNPWYERDFGEKLFTPEWTFRKTHLRRFR